MVRGVHRVGVARIGEPKPSRLRVPGARLQRSVGRIAEAWRPGEVMGMSSWKSGARIVLLAGPVMLYIAWQVRGVVRIDAASPLAAPSEAGLPTRDQLTVSRGRAETWANEVRKAVAVALQFRSLTADDRVTDDDCNALATAAAARTANLTDLETFLSGAERPEYTGALRQRYRDWYVSQMALNRAEKAIESWFTQSLTGVDSAEAAAQVWMVFAGLIADYTKEPRFSDRTKVAAWNLRARVRLIDQLAESARDPFQTVLNRKLPLPPASESAEVRKTLGALQALREHVQLLQAELTQLEEARVAVPARVVADARLAIRRAEVWIARQQLLALLTEPEVFTRADAAADWLARLQVYYDQAPVEDRDRLREKVQEFCEAFIPRVVALDEFVLLDGQKVPRSRVTVKSFPRADGQPVRTPLSAEVTGLNEFNLAEKYPGETTLVIAAATEYTPKQLQPTELSKAARVYAEARAAVGSGPGLPKWSGKSIEELKNQCKPRAAEINQLKTPDGNLEEPRIWDRLQSLSHGVTACRSLFEKPQ